MTDFVEFNKIARLSRNCVIICIFVAAISLLSAIIIREHQLQATPCNCGTICEKGFHCGLKDCPHGRN